MGAPYPPMNPSWAAGFQRQFGRAPSQGDWERQIDRNRGVQEKPGAAAQVAPYAGIAGTALGMYGASQLPGLFSAGTVAASTAAPAVAATGATAAGTGAGIAGTTAAAPVAAGATGTGIYGSIAGAAPYAAPVIAAAIAAYNTNRAYEASKGKDWEDALSDEIKKPRSWISPVSLIGGLYGSIFGGRRTYEEEKRWKDLGEDGFTLPEWVANNTNIKEQGAWSRPDLAADFVGYAPTAGEAKGIGATPEGTWVNNAFAKSRQESDLRPEDIWGYAAMSETFGKDYMATSEANRRAIAQKALDLGLVDEHHGTIDIKEDPALKEYWTSLTTPKSDNQQIADTVRDTVRRLYNK